jgi:hypothetical protein
VLLFDRTEDLVSDQFSPDLLPVLYSAVRRLGLVHLLLEEG